MVVRELDIVALTQVTLTGIAAITGAFGGVYAMVAAARAKRAETSSVANAQNIGKVQDNVALIERNTNSLSTRMAELARKDGVHEGTAIGRQEGVDQAAKLLEGQRQGAETERASAAAASAVTLTEPNKPA